jgi:hypothetical protein
MTGIHAHCPELSLELLLTLIGIVRSLVRVGDAMQVTSAEGEARVRTRESDGGSSSGKVAGRSARR